jgi:ABC-2 type transport system permease protein
MLTRVTATESKLVLRDGASVFFGLVFPAFLLVALSLVIPGFRDPIDDPGLPAELAGLRPVDIYPPVVLGLAITTVALTLVPTYLATYREQGVLRRLATTPAPPRILLTAQLLVNLAILLAGSVAAVLAAVTVLGVAWPENPAGLLLGFVLGTAASFCIGLIVAALAPSARAASAISMIVYFPMLFFAGVWTPGFAMPDAARAVADFTPVGAAVEAMTDAWFGDWPSALHLAVLLAWTVAASSVATKLFRWE